MTLSSHTELKRSWATNSPSSSLEPNVDRAHRPIYGNDPFGPLYLRAVMEKSQDIRHAQTSPAELIAPPTTPAHILVLVPLVSHRIVKEQSTTQLNCPGPKSQISDSKSQTPATRLAVSGFQVARSRSTPLHLRFQFRNLKPVCCDFQSPRRIMLRVRQNSDRISGCQPRQLRKLFEELQIRCVTMRQIDLALRVASKAPPLLLAKLCKEVRL